ncbi:MAG: hypothetical protein WC436_03060 [Candidatus Babeliales bacterium]
MYKSFFKKSLISIIFCFLYFNFVQISCYTKPLFPDVNIFFKKANNLLLRSELYQDFNSYQDLILSLNKMSAYKFATKKIQTSDLIIFFKRMDDLENICLSKKREDDRVIAQSIFENIRKGILCEFTMNHLVLFRKSLFSFLEELIVLFDFWTREMNKDSFIENFKSLLEGDAGKTKLRDMIEELDIFKNRVACYLGKIDEILLNFEKIAMQSNENLEKLKLDDDLRVCTIEGIFCINGFFTKKIDPDKPEYDESLAEFNNMPISFICSNLCTNNLNVKLMDENFFAQIYDYKIPGFFYRHWLGLTIGGSISFIAAMCILLNWDSFSQTTKVRYGKFKEGWNAYIKKVQEWFVDNFLPELMRDNEENHNKTKDQLFDQVKKHINSISKIGAKIRTEKETLNQDLDNTVEQMNENKKKSEKILSWNPFNYFKGIPVVGPKIIGTSKLTGMGSKGGLVDSLQPVLKDVKNITTDGLSVADEVGGLAKTYEAIIHKYVGNIANWILVGVPTTVVLVSSIIIIKKIINSEIQKKYDKVSNSVGEVFRILNYYNSPSVDLYQVDLSYKDQGLMSFYIDRLQDTKDGVSLDDKNKLARLINDLRNPEVSVIQKLNFIKLEWGKNLFGVV